MYAPIPPAPKLPSVFSTIGFFGFIGVRLVDQLDRNLGLNPIEGFGFFVKNQSESIKSNVRYYSLFRWYHLDFQISLLHVTSSNHRNWTVLVAYTSRNIVSDLLRIPQIKNMRKISMLFRLITIPRILKRTEMDFRIRSDSQLFADRVHGGGFYNGLNPKNPDWLIGSSIRIHNWEHWLS
jgi:hypothetical protein